MFSAQHATPGVLILLLLVLAPVFFAMRRARRGEALFVRRIPGVDAIEEACGRAAEMGRPISFSSGTTGLSPLYYACLGTLFFVARRAAVYRSRLLLPQADPEVLAITEDAVREAYRTEGRASAWDPGSIVFLSGEQFAYAAGYIGMVQRERAGAAFLFGSFAAESLILAEAGQQVGAMQVAATTSPEQVAFFVTACDYTLIGEELFAAGAYLTREPVQLGSLVGQDYAKMLFFVLIIIGVCVATWNSVFSQYMLGTLDKVVFAGW